MILSKVHDWQGNETIKQVLVFWDEQEQETFDAEFARRVEADGIEYASENGLTALAKVRAVKCSDDTWETVVRNGYDGGMMTSDNGFGTPEAALKYGLKLLRRMTTIPDLA